MAILCSLYAVNAAALDITLLGGSQGGGSVEYISTGTTLHFADDNMHGLILSLPQGHDKQLELFYSRQQTQLEQEPLVPAGDLMALDVHYLHLGGTVLSDELNGVRGFLSGGLGITHFDPSLRGASAEERASLSIGVGGRWMPSSHVGLRLEGRAFGTLFNSNTAIFCSGGCSFAVSGQLLTQYAIFAGLVLRFD